MCTDEESHLQNYSLFVICTPLIFIIATRMLLRKFTISRGVDQCVLICIIYCLLAFLFCLSGF